MNRIQFFPSENLDNRLEVKAKELGITKGSLSKELLENIVDFDELLNDKKKRKATTPGLIDLTEKVLQIVEKYATTCSEKEFILNDIEEYRNEVPLNMRAIVGKTMFKKIYEKQESSIVKVVVISDCNGDEVVKKRQRSVLYTKIIYNEK